MASDDKDLAATLRAAYTKLVTAVAQISAPQRTARTIDGTGGKVSVSDIIAYQIGWGRLLIEWYEAGLRGEIPQMPGEGFSFWDYRGLARHFYQTYHFDGHDEQDQAFQKVVDRVLDIIAIEGPKGNLDCVGVWAWCTLPSGKQWTLSKWITVNTISPYKRASAMVKKQAQNAVGVRSKR